MSEPQEVDETDGKVDYISDSEAYGRFCGIDDEYFSDFGLESLASMTNGEEITDMTEPEILSCIMPALYYNEDVDAYDGLINQIPRFLTAEDRRIARCVLK